jgi:hypothetical protein
MALGLVIVQRLAAREPVAAVGGGSAGVCDAIAAAVGGAVERRVVHTTTSLSFVTPTSS